VRLSALFRAVFTGLNEQNVRRSQPDSGRQVDSIRAVTLLTLMEEEFGEHSTWKRLAEWTLPTPRSAEMLEKRLHG